MEELEAVIATERAVQENRIELLTLAIDLIEGGAYAGLTDESTQAEAIGILVEQRDEALVELALADAAGLLAAAL